MFLKIGKCIGILLVSIVLLFGEGGENYSIGKSSFGINYSPNEIKTNYLLEYFYNAEHGPLSLCVYGKYGH